VALILSVFFVQQCIKSNFKWDFVVLAVASIIVVVSLMGGHLYAMSKKKASETPA
jgi:high-affinity Fe2+/Pb2+ permease